MADAAFSVEPLPAMHAALGLRRRMLKSYATLELKRFVDGKLKVVEHGLLDAVCICEMMKKLLTLWGQRLAEHTAGEKLLRLAMWFDEMSFAKYREPAQFASTGIRAECGKEGFILLRFHG